MQHNNFFGSEVKGSSQFWKGLHKVKHFLKCGAEYRVFKGNKARFWHDSWVGGMSLKIQVNNMFNICSEPNMWVNEAWDGSDWVIPFRRSLHGELVMEWVSILESVYLRPVRLGLFG